MKTFKDIFQEAVQEFTGWQNAVASNGMLKTGVDLLNKLQEIEPSSENLIVGGTVRDLLLGKDPHDVDIATSIDMDVIEKHFKTDEIGKSKDFGILNVHYGDYAYEVAHFRTDGTYSDARRPDDVKAVKSFAEDAARRDYTINALGIDSDGIIYDHTGGIEDLASKVIRAVGDPAKRLQDDSLRILRAIRFAVKFGFKLEPTTRDAIVDLRDSIKKVAPDRIKDEIWKVASISGSALARYIEGLDEVGLLGLILPEFKALQDKEHNFAHHPEGASSDVASKKLQRGSVYYHVLAALHQSKSTDPVVNMSIMAHDVGKATTEDAHEDTGEPTYHGHEGAGKEIIEKMAKRLKFSNDERDAILFAAAYHMHKFPTMKKSKVLAMRQSPHWDVLKQTMYADKSSRLGMYNKQNLDRDMDHADDVLQTFGKKEEFEKKMSAFVDGKLIMSLVPKIHGIDIGKIKDAAREMIIAKSFVVDVIEVKAFIRAQAIKLGYKV
jgi:tRNA nucleotidyltransferase/poly(A) polymerase